METVGQAVNIAADIHRNKIEEILGHNIAYFSGDIDPVFLNNFQKFMERIASREDKSEILGMMVTTPGGSVEAVEKMVEIMRYHYKEIHFIVPEMAMSAGTLLSLSGEKLYMDYSSSLGPIDPQVQSSKGLWVPALGHLDMVERLIQKSRDGTLSNAEFAMLQDQDLGILRRYEQALELSVDLLHKWLAKYKFKNWTKHGNQEPVTHEEKVERAKEIAAKLGDNRLWHSHSRMISMDTLKSELRLKIEDLKDYPDLGNEVNAYHSIVSEFSSKHRLFMNGWNFF